MVLHTELGRHTPPPPPYSLGKRDTTKAKLADEASQRPAPPPPPPYLNCTSKSDRTKLPIEDLWRQAIAPDDLYIRNSGDDRLLPPLPPQRFAAQKFDSQRSRGDLGGVWNSQPRSLGVPAHPVEPKWAPVGTIGYPGPPMGGASARVPKFSPERLDQSTTQSCVFRAGTRIRPEHENPSSQSPSPISLGHIVASSPTNALATMAMTDQETLHLFTKQSKKDITSLAHILTSDATASLEPPKNVCPLSTSLPQPTIKKHATPTTLATLDELSVVKKKTDVKYLVDANEDSSSDEYLGHEDNKSVRPVEAPKALEYTSSAPSKHESQLFKDRTTLPGQNGGFHIPRTSHRRPSASARFDPYKRRQSEVAEKAKQGHGGDKWYMGAQAARDAK